MLRQPALCCACLECALLSIVCCLMLYVDRVAQQGLITWTSRCSHSEARHCCFSRPFLAGKPMHGEFLTANAACIMHNQQQVASVLDLSVEVYTVGLGHHLRGFLKVVTPSQGLLDGYLSVHAFLVVPTVSWHCRPCRGMVGTTRKACMLRHPSIPPCLEAPEIAFPMCCLQGPSCGLRTLKPTMSEHTPKNQVT